MRTILLIFSYWKEEHFPLFSYDHLLNLTVDKPIGLLIQLYVKLAMDSIVASNAFFSSHGNGVGVHGSCVVENNATEYEIGNKNKAGFH